MKTLKESILKSVKAGKYSIDTTNFKTMDDVANYANWVFGDKVEVDDKNRCIKIYYNKDVTFVIYFHPKFSSASEYTRFNFMFLDKNNNVLLSNHIMSSVLDIRGMDWRCVFDIKNWVETHLKYAKHLLQYEEKHQKHPELIEEYKKDINKIKILQKLL